MHAITGITGQVGGAVARSLLAQGRRVRAVVRDARKGEAWAALGCEIAVADIADASALARAFQGVASAFILPPPVFDPAPGFAEARAVIAAVQQALRAARPPRTVCLTTIGVQAAQQNLLSQHTLMEEALAALPLPVCFLRPGWFMENLAWDIAPAREDGVLPSFLQPLDRPVPMVATQDVGALAAELLQQAGELPPIVELEGPRRVSPQDLAAALAAALQRPVQAKAVPRESWEALFRSQGMRNPLPRMRMLDGFNEGWIRFEGPDAAVRKGRTGLEEVIRGLLGRGLQA